jgi:hypothetical protein
VRTNKVTNVEEKGIAEIKSLSYLERLERLMILIEVSHTLNKVNKISTQKRRKFFINFAF